MKKWYVFKIKYQGKDYTYAIDCDNHTYDSAIEVCKKNYGTYEYLGVETEPQIGEMILVDGKEIPTESYQDTFGKVNYPDGFLEKISGLSLEEQLNHFRITESYSLAKTAYSEIENIKYHEASVKLQDYDGVVTVIVKNQMITGVRMKGWFSKERGKVVFPYERVCTYYASDNNGSGYSTREDYAYLICV